MQSLILDMTQAAGLLMLMRQNVNELTVKSLREAVRTELSPISLHLLAAKAKLLAKTTLHKILSII